MIDRKLHRSARRKRIYSAILRLREASDTLEAAVEMEKRGSEAVAVMETVAAAKEAPTVPVEATAKEAPTVPVEATAKEAPTVPVEATAKEAPTVPVEATAKESAHVAEVVLMAMESRQGEEEEPESVMAPTRQ